MTTDEIKERLKMFEERTLLTWNEALEVAALMILLKESTK